MDRQTIVEVSTAARGKPGLIDDLIADTAPGSNLVSRSASKIAQLITTALATIARTAVDRTALANAAIFSVPIVLFEGQRFGWFVSKDYVAPLAAQVDADTQQILFVRSTFNPAKVWVRQFSGPILAKWAGIYNYDPTNEINASVGLQAFFDLAKDQQLCRAYPFDWSGEWLVDRTIYAIYWDGTEPNVERRFIMGTLRVAALANLAVPNVPLDPVLYCGGQRTNWEGTCGIHPIGVLHNDFPYRPYLSRQIMTGAFIRAAADSTFGDFFVSLARRDAVVLNSDNVDLTINGTVFPNAFCESVKIGRINGNACGSTWRNGWEPPPLTPVRVQGRKASGTSFFSEIFDNVTAGQGGTNFQRTKLTASTANMRTYDLVWCRVELTAAIYGDITAAVIDANTGTFTWSAGDPTNLNGAGAGLQVGDIYPGFAGGVNYNKEFRIVSFGGTSNRTITVSPPPTAHAANATATYYQNSVKNWHWVTSIIDANNFTVFPWVADRINSTFHIQHGYTLRSLGSDLANANIAGIITNTCGGAWHSAGLYAPKCETILGQVTVIGVQLSIPFSEIHTGVNIEHGHIGIVDGLEVSILSSSINVYGTINTQSAFDLTTCWGCNARANTNSQRPAPTQLGYLQLFRQGGIINQTYNQKSNEGASWDSYGISNKVSEREVFVHTDTATLTLSFERYVSDFFPKHHWARLIWTDSDGTSPDGTLTVNLEPVLIATGWTFAGDFTGTSFAIVAPTKNVKLEFQFLVLTKKVVVTWTPTGPINVFTSAAAGIVPASGGGTVKYLRADGTWVNPIAGLSQSILAQFGGPKIDLTGTLVETTFATITVPGGAMGANGQIDAWAMFTHTNNANAKTARIKFGPTLITSFPVSANTVTSRFSNVIANRNSQSSQVAMPSNLLGPNSQGSTAVIVTGANNTANPVDIIITGQLGVITDTLSLEAYGFMLRPMA